MEKVDDAPVGSYESLRFYFFSDKIHLKTNEKEELTFDRIEQLEEPLRNSTVKSMTMWETMRLDDARIDALLPYKDVWAKAQCQIYVEAPEPIAKRALSELLLCKSLSAGALAEHFIVSGDLFELPAVRDCHRLVIESYSSSQFSVDSISKWLHSESQWHDEEEPRTLHISEDRVPLRDLVATLKEAFLNAHESHSFVVDSSVYYEDYTDMNCEIVNKSTSELFRVHSFKPEGDWMGFTVERKPTVLREGANQE
ncbi:hypothetical protein AAVH_13902 [Aphelenchoides avenae]|nr:hypothetical protein AAVH_13902 [Aphelenchus avenae]